MLNFLFYSTGIILIVFFPATTGIINCLLCGAYALFAILVDKYDSGV